MNHLEKALALLKIYPCILTSWELFNELMWLKDQTVLNHDEITWEEVSLKSFNENPLFYTCIFAHSKKFEKLWYVSIGSLKNNLQNGFIKCAKMFIDGCPQWSKAYSLDLDILELINNIKGDLMIPSLPQDEEIEMLQSLVNEINKMSKYLPIGLQESLEKIKQNNINEINNSDKEIQS